MLGDPLALLFAAMLTLYVGAEAAIYVWAPTYLEGFAGSFAWLAPLAVSIFFTLRAAGRFLGAWLLARLDWSQVLVIASVLIAGLFWMAIIGGRQIAIFALPATGLFMSVLYPTINSTGISCFERRRHGSIAGLLLFFTCVGAVIAPLVMAAAGDRFGTVYSMVVGAVFASLLAVIAGWNLIRQPAAARLAQRNASEYAVKDMNERLVGPTG
jgi:fucose permease